MAAADERFKSTGTFLPSTMIRTQLRLAVHYLKAADEGGFPLGKPQPPTLSSFVVLRAAIECTANAHWLLSSSNQRQLVERVLKRMWWDTTNAIEMATTADGGPPGDALVDLQTRIEKIARPIKGLGSVNITKSDRPLLSRIVSDASAALRPHYPKRMHAGWMLCSGIAHGNIPVSAGAGISAATVQRPAEHLIDDGSYGYVFAAVVDDVESTVELFERRAHEAHQHRRPGG